MIYYNGKKYSVWFNGGGFVEDDFDNGNNNSGSTGGGTTTGTTSGGTVSDEEIPAYDLVKTASQFSKLSDGYVSPNGSGATINDIDIKANANYNVLAEFDITGYSGCILSHSYQLIGQFLDKDKRPLKSDTWLYKKGASAIKETMRVIFPTKAPLAGKTGTTVDVKYIIFNLPVAFKDEWTVYFYKNDTYLNEPYNPAKSFTIGTWNVGKWTGGLASENLYYTAATKAAAKDAYLANLRTIGNGSLPQIMGMCEYKDTFATDGTLANEYIFNDYNQLYQDGKNHDRSIYCDKSIKVLDHGNIPGNIPSGCQYRDLQWVKILFDGKEVYIYQSHMPHDNSPLFPSGDATFYNEQKAFADQIAQLFKEHEYMIFMADCNANPRVLFTLPSGSGSTKNYGYGWGNQSMSDVAKEDIIWNETIKWTDKKGVEHTDEVTNKWWDLGTKCAVGRYVYGAKLYDPSHENMIDNIVTKGFKITNVKVGNSGSTMDKHLSDHPCVGCVLTIID